MITKEEAIKKLEATIEECKSKIELLHSSSEPQDVPTCDKNNPNDTHYGQDGDYTDTCTWIPDNG